MKVMHIDEILLFEQSCPISPKLFKFLKMGKLISYL